MKTFLSNEQVQKYREDGFLYHPGFLNGDEVAELKSAVVETARSMGKKRITDKNSSIGDDDGEDFYSKVFTQRLNLWRINETIQGYMLNPALGKMICELEGIEGVRVWHDQALIKEPFGNPTAWHLDSPYWSFATRQAVSIWIALEDATPYNGCMCFIPGTHRMATTENSGIGANMSDLFRIYPKMAEIDPVPVPMKAGDCSFHNGLVAHGAGANMTRGRRIAMTCGYMPEGSRFNGTRNILPKEYFESLKIGDVMENDEQNPIVYSEQQLAPV